MFSNPADILGIVLSGTLGRSGRKRARKAKKFLSGNKGLISAGTLIGAAGVAWGIYDTMKNQNQGASGAFSAPGASSAVPPMPGAAPQAYPPIPAAFQQAIDPLARVIQVAVSAAKADGTLSEQERAMILDHAKQTGLESIVETELAQTRPLADIVRGVTDPAVKKDLYTLAFTIIRADESVSGSERIYLAQLAHQLGLDPSAVQAIETETAAKIDAQPDTES